MVVLAMLVGCTVLGGGDTAGATTSIGPCEDQFPEPLVGGLFSLTADSGAVIEQGLNIWSNAADTRFYQSFQTAFVAADGSAAQWTSVELWGKLEEGAPGEFHGTAGIELDHPSGLVAKGTASAWQAGERHCLLAEGEGTYSILGQSDRFDWTMLVQYRDGL